jgi:DNA-binding response OmpR family regulator
MNILYIEDDVDVAQAVMDVLQPEGYNFTHTYDAETAWSKLQEAKFDIVLTDLNLPNMTGLELIQKVRESWDDVKIVGLSGFIQAEEVDRIKLLGADLILLKPITPAELSQALRSLA